MEIEIGLREAKKARNFRLLLDAACVLFREKGFEATRMEDIARRAGLAVGTCYNYFAAKGDILLAIVVEADRACVEAGWRFLERLPADPVEALASTALLASRQSLDVLDKDGWRQVLAAAHANHQSEFARAYAATTAELRGLVVAALRQIQRSGGIRSDIDPVEAGYYIHSMKYMLFVDHVLSDEPFEVHEQKVRDGIGLFVNGLVGVRRQGGAS